MPDVNIKLFDGAYLFYASGVINNVPQTGLPLSGSLISPYHLVSGFTSTINVVVIDNDLGDLPPNDDDEIGYVPFIMNDYITGPNKYPPAVTKTANGVTATLSLTWE